MDHKFTKFILFFGDAIILFLSLYLTLLIRYGSNYNPELWKLHLAPFSFLYAIWLIIFYITNLYDLAEAKISFDFYQKLLTILSICGLFSTAFFYLIPKTPIAPKTNLFLNLVIIAALFLIWRNIFNLILKSTTKNNIIIIGYTPTAYAFSKTINRNPQLGYKIVAIADQSAHDIEGIKSLRFEDNIREFIIKNNVSTVILNWKERELAEKLFQYIPLGINFVKFNEFYERLFSIVPIDCLSPGWFLENLSEGSKRMFDLFKRCIDIIASVILGLFSLILIPFIAIGIKLTSDGPVFFKQIRLGKNGKKFLAIKFRSMVVSAETNGPQWASKNDPRVTNFGKFLRKTRLDEIPQLINILKGEMSLVGPRPERPEFVKILEEEIPFYKQRLLVKPGLTGWAQINFPYGSSIEDAMHKLQFDLYYIKHRSLSLDLKIILKTIAIVFGLKGQ